MIKKPDKRKDADLFALIEKKIAETQYLFLKHAKERLKERQISDLDVLNILKGKKGYGRKRNKRKDRYEQPLFSELPEDQKYCIERNDIDGNKIRVIITFAEELNP